MPVSFYFLEYFCQGKLLNFLRLIQHLRKKPYLSLLDPLIYTYSINGFFSTKPTLNEWEKLPLRVWCHLLHVMFDVYFCFSSATFRPVFWFALWFLSQLSEKNKTDSYLFILLFLSTKIFKALCFPLIVVLNINQRFWYEVFSPSFLWILVWTLPWFKS